MAPGSTSAADIQAVIDRTLTSDVYIDKLVKKLADKLTTAVVEALSESLRAAQEEIKALKSEVSCLQEQLADTSLKQDDLEQYTRRVNLRVFGIPEKVGESTDTIVMQLLKDKLNVDLPLERLQRSHRVGRKPEPDSQGRPRHRPIIVRFLSYRDKRQVFTNKKKLKDSGIAIREDLTSNRLAVYKAAVAKYGLKNTWTADGKIIYSHGDRRGAATRLSHLT